jgi:transposase
MIGDRACGSDPLDHHIEKRYDVQVIAPHKFVRVPRATEGGRRLRRYRRRWKIERLLAWLHNFRRIVIRWKYYPANSWL